METETTKLIALLINALYNIILFPPCFTILSYLKYSNLVDAFGSTGEHT